MKKLNLEEQQEYAYQLLLELDRICAQYNIEYSLEGGSMLGAVKYGDFVPWDDDIDVIMTRENYRQFCAVAPEVLNHRYVLQNHTNTKEFPLNYAKLCDTKTFIEQYRYTPLDMCHGLFVDIFPIDNVYIKTYKLQCAAVGFLTSVKVEKLHLNSSSFGIKKILRKICSVLPLWTLNRMIDAISSRHDKRETDYCYEVCNSNKKFLPLPSYVCREYSTIVFRHHHFHIVSHYDMYLRARFSDDYMDTLPPLHERKPSHFHDNVYLLNDEE